MGVLVELTTWGEFLMKTIWDTLMLCLDLGLRRNLYREKKRDLLSSFFFFSFFGAGEGIWEANFYSQIPLLWFSLCKSLHKSNIQTPNRAVMGSFLIYFFDDEEPPKAKLSLIKKSLGPVRPKSKIIWVGLGLKFKVHGSANGLA